MARNDKFVIIGNVNEKHVSKEKVDKHDEVHDKGRVNENLRLEFSYPQNTFIQNKINFKKKVASKEMNIKDFEIFKNIQNYQKYDDNLLKTRKTATKSESYKIKATDTPFHDYEKITKIYTYNERPFLMNSKQTKFKLLENNRLPTSQILIESTKDDMEILGTAEIEAILNEIKLREIQMISQHDPSLSDLISNTVTETTFTASSSIRDQKIFSNFTFTTFLTINENHKATTESYNENNRQRDNVLQHHVYARSLKDDSCTLAQNVENILQKKCKSVFKKIKSKLSKDYNKEIQKTKQTIRGQLDKITTKIATTNKSLKNETLTTCLLSNTKPVTKSTLIRKRNIQSQLKNISTISSTHSIPVLSDDYSMLTIFELLLTKSHENNMMNVLTTKNFSAKRKRGFEERFLNINRDNSLGNSSEDTTPYEQSDQSDVTDDTSYEGLSNKIAYNDYVNGYKYYLNFQKNHDDDQKYSNLVRYQAHKHHKVDDIGKFILNKIPQLPTTRLKRKFVELETLDDQEITTKSEDSWFKKHFFIFLDKDPPKKFHSLQTVPLKEANSQNTEKYQWHKNNIISEMYNNFTTTKMNFISIRNNEERNAFDYSNFNDKVSENNKAYNFKFKRDIKKCTKNRNKKLHSHNDQKYNIYVNKAKRETNCDRKLKLRYPRKHIFKNLITIYPKYGTRQQKFFDYEVLKDVQQSTIKYNNFFKVDELIKQIPNISADFNVLYPVFDVKYINLSEHIPKSEVYRKNLYFQKPRLKTNYQNSNSLLQDKSITIDGISDDVINVDYKTVNQNKFQEGNFATFPTFFTMTKDSIVHEVDNIRTRLTSFDDDNLKLDNYKGVNFLKEPNRKSNRKTGYKNTTPVQSFKTPIPMKAEEFDNFLKEHNIDVESVTTPLRDPVVKIVESLKSNNKVSKLSSTFPSEHLDMSQNPKIQTYNAQKRHQNHRQDTFNKNRVIGVIDYSMDKGFEGRDPLRFTHMFNEDSLKLTTTNPSLRNNDLERFKTSTSLFFKQDVPNRVHVKGHSFKYDIIFHKTYDNQNHEIDTSDFERLKMSPRVFEKSKKKRHGKRDLQDNARSFTAKDVAALEVIVDLLKSTHGAKEKEAIINSIHKKNISYTPLLEKDNHLKSIQVYIAIPSVLNDKRRSLESSNVRKIFSAKMSTPVDLEYQIHSFDETTYIPTTTMKEGLSPGLYLLVANTNVTCPTGNFALKPLNSLDTSSLKLRHALLSSSSNNSKIMQLINTTKSYLSSKIKIMNTNLTTAKNDTICKRSIPDKSECSTKTYDERKKTAYKRKRKINFDYIKKLFGHDRVCHCRCKVNKTMCKPCAESDKVISELMFEFNNLEQYVVNHCTEIQTFFWMNPSSGKKLREIIHRIDKVLNDYFKRVKGKCQGRTCQMISSNIDKRSFNVNDTTQDIMKRLLILFDTLKNASATCNDDIVLAGKNCLRAFSSCLTRKPYKRSFLNNEQEKQIKTMYSLSNIKINLICDKSNTKSSSTAQNNKLTETNSHLTMYNDFGIKTKENKKGIKQFLKKYSKRKKGEKKLLLYNTDEKMFTYPL